MQSIQARPVTALAEQFRTVLVPIRGTLPFTKTLAIEDVQERLISFSLDAANRWMVLGDLGTECFRREDNTYSDAAIRCDGNWCPTCGPRKARWIGNAIDLARPSHLLTITQIGSTWPEISQRMQHLVGDLRHRGFVFEMAWHAEAPHPWALAEGGHAHGWYRGPTIPARTLSEASQRAGAGAQIDFRAVTRRDPVGMAYGVKAMSNSLRRSVPEAIAQQNEYRSFNGTRLVHSTRGRDGFWRDASGQPTDLLGAIRAAKRAHRAASETAPTSSTEDIDREQATA